MPRRCQRLWSLDALPMVRAFMYGPRWKKHFGVAFKFVAFPADGRVLAFTLEDEIRERVLDEIRPGVIAQWSDPRHV